MSFLNDLIKTYDSVIGHEPDGMEKIAPIAHQYRSTKQVIDVTINADGELAGTKFRIDNKNPERTLLAMTEESSSRTSSAAAVTPHGLNDTLKFMTKNHNIDKKSGTNKSYESYRKQLEEWCDSDYSCIQAQAVLKYITANDAVDDMLKEGVLPAEKDGHVNTDKYMKYTTRWRVIIENDGVPETWKNKETLDAWTGFYENKHCIVSDHVLDCVDGHEADREKVHAKPVSIYGNSKLISAATKEDSVLHFKGERFTDENQLPQIGYQNSQKLHNALGWLVETQGIPISKNSLPCCTTDDKPRFLVCWRPELPEDENPGFQLGMLMGRKDLKKNPKYTTYVSQMKDLFAGRDIDSLNNKNVSVFMIDRSGDGRFSPVMYRSFTASEFIETIREWHNSCAWFSYDVELKKYRIRPVSLFEIAKCTYGVQRFNKANEPYLDIDDSVFKDAVNILLFSIIDGRNIPGSFMLKLASQVMPERFAGNKGHEMQPFNEILKTACALLHWIHIRRDKQKGEKDLGLDRENCDRSYLYGRLLAVYDTIENSALNRKAEKDEKGRLDHRDTNAMRLWSTFVAHPATCAQNLQGCVIPYLTSLPYGLRNYYENELTEIYSAFTETTLLNRPLSPEYLHGFYLERAELMSKRNKEAANKEE